MPGTNRVLRGAAAPETSAGALAAAGAAGRQPASALAGCKRLPALLDTCWDCFCRFQHSTAPTPREGLQGGLHLFTAWRGTCTLPCAVSGSGIGQIFSSHGVHQLQARWRDGRPGASRPLMPCSAPGATTSTAHAAGASASHAVQPPAPPDCLPLAAGHRGCRGRGTFRHQVPNLDACAGHRPGQGSQRELGALFRRRRRRPLPVPSATTLPHDSQAGGVESCAPSLPVAGCCWG